MLGLIALCVGCCGASETGVDVNALQQKMAHRSSDDGVELPLGRPVYMRIFKEESELELWVGPEHDPPEKGAARPGPFTLVKTYPICAWSGPLGPKLKEGDGRSPEGFYFVPPQAMNPNSSYHLSFNLGFPNAYDKAHGRTGSYLMVHGKCVSIGCYAMTDEGIEEIYAMADAAHKGGQRFFRVHIFPFRMTQARLAEHAEHPWHEFWTNLKEGYDLFEVHKRPPNVRVEDKRYVFDAP